MPLGTEVGLGPTERGTVRLCSFRHISTAGLGVGVSRTSFIAVFFAIACTRYRVSISTIRVAFDVKRRSPTRFSVLAKPEVVLRAKRWQIGRYIALKLNRKSGSPTASVFMWCPPHFYFRFGRRR